MQKLNNVYRTEYSDYSRNIVIMISTDQQIFLDKSAVRARMIEYSKLYKELHIIIFSKRKIEPIEITQNCKVYSTNSYVRWNYVSDARRIGKRIIKESNKEIPILVSCQDPFETGLVGKCLINLRKNTELLIQIHTDLFSPYFIDKRIGFINANLNRVRLFISKFTLSHAQIIRVVSKKIADSLVERGISSENIIIKPIEVKVDHIKSAQPSFSLHEKYPQFSKIILMVSRIESEKNISMAIEALGEIKAKIPNIGMIIVGSGSNLHELEIQAYRLKLEPNIAFVGWQTDLVPYYKGCDVFLNTSWFEGYGMTLVEAQASGCKIVSTDVGIARDVGANIVDWSIHDIADKVFEVLSK